MDNFFIDIINWVENYFSGMSDAEFYSTIAIAGAAVFFIIVERIWPYTKGQRVLREGFLTISRFTQLHKVIFSEF
ncbi:MAG: hypothetical protein OEM46_10065 [Ignavibacteria bacterium]|nr:hypothetical protein [Ignavibacteria bacterium]